MADTLEYIIRIRGGEESAVEVRKVEHEVDKLGDKTKRLNAEAKASPSSWDKFNGALGKASSHLGALATAGIALGPALVPVLGVATAGVGAFGAAFGPATLAAAGFGKIFAGQATALSQSATQIEAAQQKVNATYGPAFASQHASAVKNLTLLNRELTDKFGPGAQGAIQSMQAMTQAHDQFVQSFNRPVTSLLTVAAHALTKLLPILQPMLMAAGNAFVDIGRNIEKGIGGQGFRHAITWMTSQVGPGIKAFVQIIANLGRGFFELIKAFNPMAGGMRSGLVSMTRAFAEWAKHLSSSGGFQSFLQYVRTEGPKVGQALGAIGHAVVGMLPVLAAAGHSSLILVKAMGDFLQWLNQSGPIGRFVGALIPFLVIALKLAPAIKAVGEAYKAVKVMMLAESTPFLLTPMGLLLMGLVLIAVVIATHWSETKRILNSVWSWMKGAAFDTAHWVTRAFGDMLNFITGIPDQIKKAFSGGLGAIGDIFTGKAVGLGGDHSGVLGTGIHLPGLAAGGTVRSAGHVLVGENGPEALSLPRGAQVSPLPAMSPRGGGDIVLKIDGREFARVGAQQSLAMQAAGA